MVAFFENHTALQFVSGSWIADIQGDLPGAGTGGRSVGPKPINMRRINEEPAPKLRPQLYETSFLGLGIMAGPDLQAFLHATTSVKGFFHAGWRVAFHVLDLVTNRQGMQLVNGTALIARLAKSADDLGVRLLVNTPAKRLLTEDGAVTGAVLTARTGRSPSAPGAASCSRPAVSPTTSRVVASCSRGPRRDRSTGRSRRRRRPATGSRSASRQAGCSTRRWPLRPLVPGVAGALPQRTGRHLPAHRRPGQARSHRRPVERQAVRQRGRRLLPVHQRDDRRRPGGRRGRSVADLRPRVPAPLPVRHVQAVPRAGMALRPVGIPQARRGRWRNSRASAASIPPD